jgi:hypothetical protein
VPDLKDVQSRHNRYIDSLVASFERELSAIVNIAMARTQARLTESLSLADGRIARSIGNARTLRKLDAVLLEEMDRAGYQYLLSEFVAQFPGQLPYFRETLDILSASMKTPLPAVAFGPRDINAFTAQAELAKDGIAAAVEGIAARAKSKAMLAIGGAPFSELVGSLAEAVSSSLPQVVGLAETATATHYRVIADRGYRIIEAETPGKLKYSFEGPLDKLTRPFCTRLLKTRRVFSRAQIDAMDNGQLPNVFITGGGWRCRHQWILAG